MKGVLSIQEIFFSAQGQIRFNPPEATDEHRDCRTTALHPMPPASTLELTDLDIGAFIIDSQHPLGYAPADEPAPLLPDASVID